MKKSAILGTTAAAVLVAGGAIGGYALTQDEPTPEATVQAVTAEPTPEATPSTTPTPESTEAPVATPGPSATSAPVPVTPTPEPSPETISNRDFFIEWAKPYYESIGFPLTDDQVVAAATYVCDQLAAGVGKWDIVALDGAGEQPNRTFTASADEYFCEEQ